MIVVKLFGGLGNQMFQYAFGRQVQTVLKQPLILDISALESGSRKYSLNYFILTDDVYTDSSGKYDFYYESNVNMLLYVGKKMCPEFMFKIMSKKGIYVWDKVIYKDVEIVKHNNIYIHGYWQSELYFYSIRNKIKKELTFSKDALKKSLLIAEKMDKENTVCVHIRRTDFLSTQNALSNCTNMYYQKAMEYLELFVESPVYYIFSDDIEEVKNSFSFGRRKFVFIEQMGSDLEEFRLMCRCKFFIMANSTFSWWASYLAQYEDKIIIAPKQWYNDGRDEKNLKRKDMILIESY